MRGKKEDIICLPAPAELATGHRVDLSSGNERNNFFAL
jgi:hypothetical protein